MRNIVGLVLLLFYVNSYAGSLENVQDTKELCQKAADTFGAGKAKESFDVLKPYWPMPKQEMENLSYQTETQLQMVSERFGEILGADFVDTKVAGTSFVRHTYIVKFEKHAVRYICLFYKPRDEWFVNGVFWDDQTPALFN